jgi:preprotein translocase subunit YajC
MHWTPATLPAIMKRKLEDLSQRRTGLMPGRCYRQAACNVSYFCCITFPHLTDRSKEIYPYEQLWDFLQAVPGHQRLGGTGIGMIYDRLHRSSSFLSSTFFLIRPSRKEEKNKKALLSRLEIGDSVLTSSGFYGVVIDIADDTVIVEFGNNKNCRIPMQKEAIVQIEKPEDSVDKPAEETKNAAPSDDDKKDKKKGFLKK